MLSVIVPVLNEEAALPSFLSMVDSWQHPCEVIFSDGGSTDRTLELLTSRNVCRGPKGRGAQCDRAIKASAGNNILILHADTHIENSALKHIEETLAQGNTWGCLTIDFTSHAPEYQFGIRKSNLRARIGGTPFGDQAMFMTREALETVGGIPNLPLMEDYELSRRLRKTYGWPKQLPDIVTASVRRFEAGGSVKVGFQMGWLRFLYRLGVPPHKINQMYGDIRGHQQ